MRSILYLLPVLAVLLSCQEAKQTKFEMEGVSLTCPKGWAITEQDSVEDGGYYLSLEKEGFDSSGLLNVSWIDNELDLNEWLVIYRDVLKDNIIYRNSNLTFGEPFVSTFNNIPSQAMTFTVSIIGLKHEGTIHAFYGANKTIAILRQEAIEDKAKNREGFDFIEKSFTVK